MPTVTKPVHVDLFASVLSEVAVGLISSQQMDSMSVKSTLLFDYYYRYCDWSDGHLHVTLVGLVHVPCFLIIAELMLWTTFCGACYDIFRLSLITRKLQKTKRSPSKGEKGQAFTCIDGVF